MHYGEHLFHDAVDLGAGFGAFRGAGKGEEIFHDFFTLQPLFLNHLQGLMHLRGVPGPFQQVFGEPEDHRDGVVDFMGHARGQSPHGGQFLHVDEAVFDGLAAGDVPGNDLISEGLPLFIPQAHNTGGEPELLVADGHLVAHAAGAAGLLHFFEPFQMELR